MLSFFVSGFHNIWLLWNQLLTDCILKHTRKCLCGNALVSHLNKGREKAAACVCVIRTVSAMKPRPRFRGPVQITQKTTGVEEWQTHWQRALCFWKWRSVVASPWVHLSLSLSEWWKLPPAPSASSGVVCLNPPVHFYWPQTANYVHLRLINLYTCTIAHYTPENTALLRKLPTVYTPENTALLRTLPTVYTPC